MPVSKLLYTAVIYFKDNTEVAENFPATCHTEANNIAQRLMKERKGVHYNVGPYIEPDDVKELKTKFRPR